MTAEASQTADERDISVQVDEAFDHVSHGYSTTLPKLIAETRKRGIPDDDVKAYLQDEEASWETPKYRGWRSKTGESFLYRFQCEFYTVASVNEMFNELANT